MSKTSHVPTDAAEKFCRRYWYPLLGLILLLALYLRWPWPEPGWEHIDERHFLMRPLGFWSGDLNPHYFMYPTLHMYLLSILFYLYYLLFQNLPLEQFVAYQYFVDGDDLLAIARGCNTVMSVGVVAVSAYLARRLYGWLGGLLAASILAVMLLSVRFAHLANTDNPSTLWISLALVWALRLKEEGHLLAYLVAGVFVGLAGATKYPAALVAVPVTVAALMRMPSLLQGRLWMAGGAAMLTFCLTSPFVLLDPVQAWEDFSLMGRLHLLTEEAAADEPSGLYHLRHNLRYGLGVAGLLAFFASLVVRPRAWRRDEMVVVAAFITFFGLLVSAESVFMRYALPLAPILAVLMVRSVIQLRRSRLLLWVAMAVLLAEPLYASVRTRGLLSAEDTREQAIRWVAEHAPSAVRLVNLPPSFGDVQVLTPGYVYIRQKVFVVSYGVEGLMRALAWLSQQDDLPPLYLSLSPKAVQGDLVDSESADKRQAVLLHYQHPIYPSGTEESEYTPQLMGLSDWDAEFSPGPIEDAVFDWVDWHFVPIGGFGDSERTGPKIRVGRLPATEMATIKTSDFFRVLHDLLSGSMATQHMEWERAIGIYNGILETSVPVDKALSADYLFDLYFNMALAHQSLHRFEVAANYWSKSIETRPDDVRAHNNLAAAHYNLSHVDQAIRMWEQVVELDPNFAGAYDNIGKARYNRGEFQYALEVWQQTAELRPDYPKINYNIGNAYYRLGDWSRASSAYERATALKPNDPDIYNNMAQAYIKLGNRELAIRALEKAVELQQGDANVYIRLANLYNNLGQVAKASDLFRRALEIDPGHSERNNIIRFLGKSAE